MPFADVSTTSDNETVTSKFLVVIHADYVTSSTPTDGVAGEYTKVNTPSSLKLVTVTVRYVESGRTILVTRNTKVQ
jgi:hypothetical protein